MRILAIHPGAHDASAAVFDNYRLIAAVGEERLTRQKGSGGGIPWLAIDEVLRIARWTRLDVDAIATTRAFYPLAFLRPPLIKELDFAVRRHRSKDLAVREIWRECQRRGTADTHSIFAADRFLYLTVSDPTSLFILQTTMRLTVFQLCFSPTGATR